MNHQLLCALAGQRKADLMDSATGARPGRGGRPLRSVRERTGWTLVALGLRLASEPARGGRPIAPSAR
jgi:hypothetical protein